MGDNMRRVSAGESLGGPEKLASLSEAEFPQQATEAPDAPGGGLHWKGENQAWVMTGPKQRQLCLWP